MFEKIYIHIGMHKTGSSYIQHCLNKLSAGGMLADVDYPLTSGTVEDFSSQTGNGQLIADFLIRGQDGGASVGSLKAHVDRLFEISNPNKSAVLISSEEFWLISAGDFNDLKEELLRYAREVVPLIVVRPLDEVCKSAYQQIVKDTGACFGYDKNFVREYCGEVILGLNKLERYFDGEIVVYDRGGVLEDFLISIGENPSLSSGFDGVKVNRGLSDLELELLRLINSVFESKDLSLAVCKAWVSSRPDLDFKSKVAKINCREEFLKLVVDSGISNEYVLRVVNILVGSGLDDCELIRSSDDAVKLDFEWSDLIRLLGVALCEIKKLGLGLDAFYSYIDKENIPLTTESFDPLMYLLINKDVLLAGDNPYRHYREFGAKENRFTSYNANSLLLI